VIKSFRGKDTELIFNKQKSRKIPPPIHRAAYRKLIILHHAKEIRDLKALPGNHYEELEKERKGQSSIKINDQYRVCFRWDQGDAYDVEIVDYH
jgi:proteic killer suppression protein